MQAGEGCISLGRHGVRYSDVRVVHVKIGGVCWTRYFGDVRRAAFSQTFPIDVYKPRMALKLVKWHSFNSVKGLELKCYLKITNAVLAQPVVGSANQFSHQIFRIVGNFTATIRRQIKAVLLQT